MGVGRGVSVRKRRRGTCHRGGREERRRRGTRTQRDPGWFRAVAERSSRRSARRGARRARALALGSRPLVADRVRAGSRPRSAARGGGSRAARGRENRPRPRRGRRFDRRRRAPLHRLHGVGHVHDDDAVGHAGLAHADELLALHREIGERDALRVDARARELGEGRGRGRSVAPRRHPSRESPAEI